MKEGAGGGSSRKSRAIEIAASSAKEFEQMGPNDFEIFFVSVSCVKLE